MQLGFAEQSAKRINCRDCGALLVLSLTRKQRYGKYYFVTFYGFEKWSVIFLDQNEV